VKTPGTNDPLFRAAIAALFFCASFTARAADLNLQVDPQVVLSATQPELLAPGSPANGYLSSGSPFASWLDMVSATQAAQPSWMTPLVTVTPRLEQESRSDFYDQQNGTGSEGNGQRIISYGGPGGPRVELIPAWNWEVILAPPPYVTATGPKGDAQGAGD
jgi:hypothetical protein